VFGSTALAADFSGSEGLLAAGFGVVWLARAREASSLPTSGTTNVGWRGTAAVCLRPAAAARTTGCERIAMMRNMLMQYNGVLEEQGWWQTQRARQRQRTNGRMEE